MSEWINELVSEWVKIIKILIVKAELTDFINQTTFSLNLNFVFNYFFFLICLYFKSCDPNLQQQSSTHPALGYYRKFKNQT